MRYCCAEKLIKKNKRRYLENKNMLEQTLLEAHKEDRGLAKKIEKKLTHPELNMDRYYLNVASDPYFVVLSAFRHYIHEISNAYFAGIVKARHMDLFLMTSSVSSPSGSGSDSVPISLSFGGHNTYLADSSQFGFEPVLVGGIPRAYCYLASMRGEDADSRHLNQFYHCEYEAQDRFATVQKVAEGYIKVLISLVINMPNLIKIISKDPAASMAIARSILETDKFDQMTFDEAEVILKKNNYASDIRETALGKDITNKGEIHLLEIIGNKKPIWLTQQYRDRVAFYQKPLKSNPDRVMGADLLFPSLCPNGFGGEVLGMGERQDDPEEMYESMRRQGVDPSPYEWYVDIRRLPQYKTTSGFGLGIERFISWILGFDYIHKAILYPRMKGSRMTP